MYFDFGDWSSLACNAAGSSMRLFFVTCGIVVGTGGSLSNNSFVLRVCSDSFVSLGGVGGSSVDIYCVGACIRFGSVSSTTTTLSTSINVRDI